MSEERKNDYIAKAELLKQLSKQGSVFVEKAHNIEDISRANSSHLRKQMKDWINER